MRAAPALQLALSLVAAVVSVLLFAPALRFVRAYWLQMAAPEWAGDHIRPRPLATAGLLLHLLMPLLTSLLWVSGSRVLVARVCVWKGEDSQAGAALGSCSTAVLPCRFLPGVPS